MEKFIEDFSKIPQRQKLIALLAAVVLLGMLHYFLIYDGQSTELSDKEQQSDKLNADLVEKQAIAENLDKYRVEIHRLENELEKAKSLLPDESEVPALLAQISSLGSKAGLEISRFEPQHEEAKDFYARLPFRVKVAGSYHEVASFIDSVGHLERIVNVENISMKEPAIKNKKYVLNTEFTVTTYRFIDKAEQAANVDPNAPPPPPAPAGAAP
jgi:type IV pilus assembly protein PilO